MKYDTQILVLEDDLDQVKEFLPKFKSMCEAWNLDKKEGHREKHEYDINYEIIFKNYGTKEDPNWLVESIRTSEERLKNLFMENNKYAYRWWE